MARRLLREPVPAAPRAGSPRAASAVATLLLLSCTGSFAAPRTPAPQLAVPPADHDPVVGPAELWSGHAHFDADPAFSFPHVFRAENEETLSENSSFFANGKFYLYYREIDGKNVARIALATSTDGDRFKRVQHVLDGPPETVDAYSPGVVYRNGTVYMVYEARKSGSMPDVYLATSTDFVTFQRKGLLVPHDPSVFWESVNTGTPSLNFYFDRWFVWYHGWRGPNAIAELFRGFAVTSEPGAPLSRPTLSRFASPALYPGEPGSWDGVGIGHADVLSDGAHLYMVYEGASGAATCDEKHHGRYGWGVARSADFTSWTKFAGNPIAHSPTGCGVAMPSWFFDPNRRKLGVIYTGRHGGLHRAWLVAGPPSASNRVELD